MLVLQRYVGEQIYIGDSVIVTLVEVRGDRARIGIAAPADVAVHRREIAERIEREQAARDRQALAIRDGREMDTRASVITGRD